MGSWGNFWPFCQTPNISDIVEKAYVHEKHKFVEHLADALTLKNCTCNLDEAQKDSDRTHALSYFVLGAGFSLLFKFAYSEYRAFYSMINALKNGESDGMNQKNGESDGKNQRSVSVHEFIKYR